jgi:hypothetical protein
VRIQGAHECAVFALRAKIGVDLPQARFNAELRDATRCLASQRGCARQYLLLVVALWNLGDIDDIHVTEVIELGCARLPHANDGEGNIARIKLVSGSREHERHVNHSACHIGQSTGHSLDHSERS